MNVLFARKLDHHERTNYLCCCRRQEVDGGALKVESGGYARFIGSVSFTDIKIASETGGEDFSPDVWNGGAIYNEVRYRSPIRTTRKCCRSFADNDPCKMSNIFVLIAMNGVYSSRRVRQQWQDEIFAVQRLRMSRVRRVGGR